MSRRKVLTAILLFTAAGAVWGNHSSRDTDPRHWVRRAYGGLRFYAWGAATLVGTVLLLLDAIPKDRWSRLDGLFPLRGRWLRYLVMGVVAILFVGLFLTPLLITF